MTKAITKWTEVMEKMQTPVLPHSSSTPIRKTHPSPTKNSSQQQNVEEKNHNVEKTKTHHTATPQKDIITANPSLENNNDMPVLDQIQSSSHSEHSNKRKAADDKYNAPKRRCKATSSTQQDARDAFTHAVLKIPDWLPQHFCPITYVIIKFLWTHEETSYQILKIHNNDRGQNNKSYRLKFHRIGQDIASKFDDEMKSYHLQDKSLMLPHVLPWYKLHKPEWKRKQIHPNTARNCLNKFRPKTKMDFMDNFLAKIGGKI